jgi:predicted nuclease of predicted toxin-antitoxin system
LRNKPNPICVLLDEGAPVLAGEPFSRAGYQVIHHREVLSSGAKDDLVAAAAILNNAILIAVDRDMKQMAKRFGNADKGGKYSKLHLLFVNCNSVLAPKRIEHGLSFIEHEWEFTTQKTARTLWIEIGSHYFRSYR